MLKYGLRYRSQSYCTSLDFKHIPSHGDDDKPDCGGTKADPAVIILIQVLIATLKMQPKKKRPRYHPRSDKGESHAISETPRSDKGASHQRPAAPRSDIGLCHQTRTSESRSEWSILPLPVAEGSCQGSESLLTRSTRSDKGGTHHKSLPPPPGDTLSAAQIYGEKYQSELRFLTCACCAFEGPRSGYRLLSDLKARGCLSWHRHTKRMIVEALTDSDSKYDRKYATILRDGLDEFGMLPKCKVSLFLTNYVNVST